MGIFAAYWLCIVGRNEKKACQEIRQENLLSVAELVMVCPQKYKLMFSKLKYYSKYILKILNLSCNYKLILVKIDYIDCFCPYWLQAKECKKFLEASCITDDKYFKSYKIFIFDKYVKMFKLS